MNVVYSTIAHFKAAGFRLIRILEYNWNSTLALESYCEFTAECKMIRLRLNMHEIKLRRLPSNTTACFPNNSFNTFLQYLQVREAFFVSVPVGTKCEQSV